ERLSMLQRLAEICEQKLSDNHAAFKWWAHALAEEPNSELAGEEVERLARDVGAWREAVELYRRIIAERQDAEMQRKTGLKLGRVYMIELRDAGNAEETYHAVLKIDDKDAEALAALDKLYEAAAMWNELAGILVRRIGTTSVTDEIIEFYFRLGRIYAE